MPYFLKLTHHSTNFFRWRDPNSPLVQIKSGHFNLPGFYITLCCLYSTDHLPISVDILHLSACNNKMSVQPLLCKFQILRHYNLALIRRVIIWIYGISPEFIFLSPHHFPCYTVKCKYNHIACNDRRSYRC